MVLGFCRWLKNDWVLLLRRVKLLIFGIDNGAIYVGFLFVILF